jgi:hypothetical protein
MADNIYRGPKPRAYDSLSPKDKAKEDSQNERDLKARKKPVRVMKRKPKARK